MVCGAVWPKAVYASIKSSLNSARVWKNLISLAARECSCSTCGRPFFSGEKLNCEKKNKKTKKENKKKSTNRVNEKLKSKTARGTREQEINSISRL